MNIANKTYLKIVLVALSLMFFSAHAQFWKKQSQALLPDHQAFVEDARIEGSDLVVGWQIAEDYYMYRDQFDVVALSPGFSFGSADYPEGLVEDDPEFGEVVVYFDRVEYRLPITGYPSQTGEKSNDGFGQSSQTMELELELKGQGCNKPVGVCYAPQTRTVKLAFQPPNEAVINDQNRAKVDAVDDTQSPNRNSSSTADPKSFWSYVAAAFGAGILLSFTPCVLPMIPILAGVIAGQNNPSKMRSGWLAICYVGGTTITYAIAGWVAGASGTQLQAYFQSPWVIGVICSFLIVLAASLFGAFKIQLPSSLQTKLNGTSVNSRSASISSFGLGLISALVVGACVSPILIVTLGAAISKGDPVLGMAIMSAMALGMGSLLILFGFGAGWLLPRTGAWMDNIQVLFGFMVLGVAIFIASALPWLPQLYLWAALLFWSGCYLLRFAAQLNADLVSSLVKASGIAALIWAGMALVGGSTGGSDILKPLHSATFFNGNSNNNVGNKKLPFEVVTTASQADSLLDKARLTGQPVLIDFYADWCLDCKRMDRTTFLEPSVHEATKGWTLIKIDVTKTNNDSETVKKRFQVFGPPATLFVGANGVERQDLRQYGYLDESEFLSLISLANR